MQKIKIDIGEIQSKAGRVQFSNRVLPETKTTFELLSKKLNISPSNILDGLAVQIEQQLNLSQSKEN